VIPYAGAVRGRWVNATGVPVTTVAVGSTIYFELDVQMVEGWTITSFSTSVGYDSHLTLIGAGSDLNCSNPGGQATCPSGSPATGNRDVMDEFHSTTSHGWLDFYTFNGMSAAGEGIQGLARLQFTAALRGNFSPYLLGLNATGPDGVISIGWRLQVLFPPPLVIT
jgi:hypothetical protein